MSREENIALLGTIPAEQKVWVGSLAHETTTEELDAHFRQLGEPVCVEILKKGLGCVAYETAEEATTAISAFNGSEVGGAVIQTDVWTQKPKGEGKGKGKGKAGGMGKNTFGVQAGKAGKGAGKNAWGPPAQAAFGGGGKAGGFAAMASSANQVYWVNVGDNSLTQQGYGPDGPAMVFEKGQSAFSSGSHILGDIVGDIAAEVEIVHDDNWEQFPEIGEVIKAATGEDHCFAVGVCANRNKWALGCGSGWKGRESAVKLALAVALASEDPNVAGQLARNYPEFGPILRSQGVSVAPPKAGGAAAWGGAAAAGGAAAGGSGDPPPVHFLNLDQESKITAAGFPAEAPAISYSKQQKEYFSNAHSILCEMVPEITDITFEEDTEWTIMPEVGAALTAAGVEENSFCVASCEAQGVWAVGLGGKKPRETAAKLALSVALAQATGRLEELAASYPEFGELCAGAGLVQAPKKRRKGAW